MFAIKDLYKNPFGKHKRDSPGLFFLGNMMTGGAAGATSLLFIYPLEFSRIRQAMDVQVSPQREFKGTWDCFSQIYKSNGI